MGIGCDMSKGMRGEQKDEGGSGIDVGSVYCCSWTIRKAKGESYTSPERGFHAAKKMGLEGERRDSVGRGLKPSQADVPRAKIGPRSRIWPKKENC